MRLLSNIYFFFYSREDCIDIDVKASGLTKQMEKDLLEEMGYNEQSDDDDNVEKEKEFFNPESTENEIEALQLGIAEIVVQDFNCDVEPSVMSATTMDPSIIKKRTKISLKKREKKVMTRKLVKGEANATMRVRRENKDTIHQSSGIWGWE